MKIVRVGILIGTDLVGGTENQMSYLANGLDKSKFNVTVFVLRNNFLKNKLKDRVKFNCRRINLHDNRYFPNLSKTIYINSLRRYKFDILLINGAQKNINFAIQSKKYVKKIFISIRNIRFVNEKSFKSDVNKVRVEKFRIICNSRPIKDQLINAASLKENLITVINNGIFCRKKIPKTKTKLKKIFRVMFVGNLRPVKNPNFFINVAKEICIEKKLKIEFLLVGDGPLMNSIKKFVSDNNLKENIRLLGKLPVNLIPYDEVNLVFNSSVSEGSSNSILESLCHGLPVVASNNEGNSYILKNKSFGSMFDIESIESAKKAIEYFYNMDFKKISKISEEAISFVKKDYSKNKMISSYSNFFLKSLNVK